MAHVFNKTKKNFTQISNSLLTDKELTFGARGLMALMLSRPEIWDFNMQEIASNTNESYYAVQKLMKELVDKKYIFRLKRGVPGEKGKFEWLYFLNEIPFNELEICEIEKEHSRKKNIFNDNTDLRQSLITTIVNNDDRKLGQYINTDLLINTENNINTETCNVASFGINEKGFPIKDKWEKFLVENLKGINYIPQVEKSILNLERGMGEKKVEKYLLETYTNGLANEYNLNLIADYIMKGERINIAAPKTIVIENKVTDFPVTPKEKIDYMKKITPEEEVNKIKDRLLKDLESFNVTGQEAEKIVEEDLGRIFLNRFNKLKEVG